MQYLSYVIKKAVDRVVVKEDDFYLQEKSFIDLLIKDEEINKINLENTNNMFWIPVSDSKLETKDFPNINIPINNKNFSNTKDNFGFPDLE